MPHADAVNRHTPIARVVGLGLALAAVVAVIVLAFSWPSVTAEAKDLPIAITGPAEAVDAAEAAVDEQQPGAIAFVEVDDRDAAVSAIETREVYGAVVLGQAPEVLTTSAGSLVVAQLLGTVATNLEEGVNAQAAAAAEAAGAPTAPPHIDVAVTDVVPLADTDPRGTGLAAALFPLVLGGMLGGIAISLSVIGAMRRVLAVVVYAAAGGLVLAGILQGWFGALQGDYWLNAAAIGLALAAIAAPITGFVALFGRAGIAVGPVVMLLFANPISAAAIPKEFIAEPWGEIGQWFPPGAAATLVRDLSYFPAADTTFPWLVLAAWAVGGLLLSVVGHFRTAGGAEPDAEAAVEA
ncbi:hypothetical protein PX701_03700 [Agromyces sp. H3Y2-19a]|uniref:hypothetical protein n=1 Tax=Agromyces TaxID=33877 RepID=UPI001E5E52A2|nr:MULTISPECIES: hypothetical protein [Agromyces]MCD5346354.1 hypothetical protein [Agromyces sp. S2-1-8]MDF0512719.1 hypothetical protein [Agromyces chromiiresistens]